MTQILPVKTYHAADRMRDLLDDNPHLLPALSRFGIALGFGDATVSDVCKSNSVHCSTFLAVANIISGYPHSHIKVDIDALTIYLKNAHAYFLDYVIPAIRTRLIEAISTSANYDLSLVVIRFFDEYVSEMQSNIDYENNEILNNSRIIDDNFRDVLDKFQEHHHTITDKLREMKELLICHFQAESARTDILNSLLFDIMTFERDMLAHCQVEDLLFVPAILGINISVSGNEGKAGVRQNGKNLDSNGDILLTPRERDIVRAIARGLSNKEIAEDLFLSVHTVTTHRRNISAKLGIHSASGMTLYAILHDLISLDEGKQLLNK